MSPVSSMIAQSPAAQYVSQRGLQHGLKPFFRYVPALMKAIPDLFHPIDNPNGYIITTLSENTQMAEELMMKLAQRPLIPFSKLQLGDFNGSPELRDGIRKLINREISTNIDLHENHIMCLGGAAAIMTSSACALFNPGEALLILAPCYPGFFSDFTVPGDVHTVTVSLEHPHYNIDLDQLERSYQQSIKDGHQPRAIIVTNPQNPTGLCYSKEELTALLRWVRAKKLFYISSEVYGTTCHQAPQTTSQSTASSFSGNQFVSIIDVAYEELQRRSRENQQQKIDLSKVLGDDIQIIWSASKDLGLSGLRVGASICQNPLVHAAMNPYGIPAQISREAQYTVALLLNDAEWISQYFTTMRSKLNQGCALVEQTLERLNIPFVKPYGGLFVWFDLSEFIPLYLYQQTLKKATSGEQSPGQASTTSGSESPQKSSPISTQQQPTDVELNEAEWAIFEEIFFTYRLGLTPGLDFAPSKRTITVPDAFMKATGFKATMPATWSTSAGFMRSCFGAVPIPFIGLSTQRLEQFITDKRQEIQDIITKSNK